MKNAVLVLPLLIAGCGITAGIQEAPSALSSLEAAKVELLTAPLAGCVSLIQRTNGIIQGMETGAPGVRLR